MNTFSFLSAENAIGDDEEEDDDDDDDDDDEKDDERVVIKKPKLKVGGVFFLSHPSLSAFF